MGGTFVSTTGETLTYSYFNTGSKAETVSSFSYVISYGLGEAQDDYNYSDTQTADYAYDNKRQRDLRGPDPPFRRRL